MEKDKITRIINGCKNKDHLLRTIYKDVRFGDEVAVVRWCENCGAIVVDLDYDGRTYPGYYGKMKQPKATKELIFG